MLANVMQNRKLKDVDTTQLAHFFSLPLLQKETAQASLPNDERCLVWGQVVPDIRAEAVLY